MGITKKQLYVIAYDVADDHRRQQVVKHLERLGVRINLSVFECMLTSIQIAKLEKSLIAIIHHKEDTVVVYPICRDCYAKTIYLPESRRLVSKNVIVV